LEEVKQSPLLTLLDNEESKAANQDSNVQKGRARAFASLGQKLADHELAALKILF